MSKIKIFAIFLVSNILCQQDKTAFVLRSDKQTYVVGTPYEKMVRDLKSKIPTAKDRKNLEYKLIIIDLINKKIKECFASELEEREIKRTKSTDKKDIAKSLNTVDSADYIEKQYIRNTITYDRKSEIKQVKADEINSIIYLLNKLITCTDFNPEQIFGEVIVKKSWISGKTIYYINDSIPTENLNKYLQLVEQVAQLLFEKPKDFKTKISSILSNLDKTLVLNTKGYLGQSEHPKRSALIVRFKDAIDAELDKIKIPEKSTQPSFKEQAAKLADEFDAIKNLKEKANQMSSIYQQAIDLKQKVKDEGILGTLATIISSTKPQAVEQPRPVEKPAPPVVKPQPTPKPIPRPKPEPVKPQPKPVVPAPPKPVIIPQPQPEPKLEPVTEKVEEVMSPEEMLNHFVELQNELMVLDNIKN